MCVVDQHVEFLQEILSENAPQVLIFGMEILEVINQDLLVGNTFIAGFDQGELRVGSRPARSDS